MKRKTGYSPVYKVSVEEVGVGLRGLTVQLEHVHEVKVLTVNVSAHGELIPWMTK